VSLVARDYLSIGEVLVNLKAEFPDVTISKIRFLESEGLIAPERTSSGYRKFYDEDVQRLRTILKLQRDEYLPLRVIRERIDAGGDGSGPAEPGETASTPDDHAEDEMSLPPTDVQMTAAELSTATGVDKEIVEQLESYGLIRSQTADGEKQYGGDDLVILRVVKDFFKFGVEPRHLTMYRHFADREAGFFEAIILPVLRQRNPEARKTAAESLTELSRIARRLKQALLRANLRKHLD
jgi:DNA-binding transcriptional MerR regulator